MIFLGEFDDIEDVKQAFEINDSDLAGVEILLASYDIDGYEGDAFVVFFKDGQFYEVNGGHCSCYGLEGQWEPEITSKALLKEMISGDRTFSYIKPYEAELKALLERLDKE